MVSSIDQVTRTVLNTKRPEHRQQGGQFPEVNRHCPERVPCPPDHAATAPADARPTSRSTTGLPSPLAQTALAAAAAAALGVVGDILATADGLRREAVGAEEEAQHQAEGLRETV